MSWLAQSRNRVCCYLLDERLKKGQVPDLFERYLYYLHFFGVPVLSIAAREPDQNAHTDVHFHGFIRVSTSEFPQI
jgi:hypothetical protein